MPHPSKQFVRFQLNEEMQIWWCFSLFSSLFLCDSEKEVSNAPLERFDSKWKMFRCWKVVGALLQMRTTTTRRRTTRTRSSRSGRADSRCPRSTTTARRPTPPRCSSGAHKGSCDEAILVLMLWNRGCAVRIDVFFRKGVLMWQTK